MPAALPNAPASVPLSTRIRLFFWTPTDVTRWSTLAKVRAGGLDIQVVQLERMYFGRWSRLCWKREKCYARVVDLNPTPYPQPRVH